MPGDDCEAPTETDNNVTVPHSPAGVRKLCPLAGQGPTGGFFCKYIDHSGWHVKLIWWKKLKVALAFFCKGKFSQIVLH